MKNPIAIIKCLNISTAIMLFNIHVNLRALKANTSILCISKNAEQI